MSHRTKEDILHQILVAFGQGTGHMRVSSSATRALVCRYAALIDEKNVVQRWEEVASQALERIRAIGRLAALLAIKDGRTDITGEDVKVAMPRIEKKSRTDICSS